MSEWKIVSDFPEHLDNVWVAIHWRDDFIDEWITSNRPLSREELRKVEKRAKYSVNLTRLGFDFCGNQVFVVEYLMFGTEEKMREAEKMGFGEYERAKDMDVWWF